MVDVTRMPWERARYSKLAGAGEVDLDGDVLAAEQREGRGSRCLQDSINAALEKAHIAAGYPEDESHPTNQVKITFVIKAELFV